MKRHRRRRNQPKRPPRIKIVVALRHPIARTLIDEAIAEHVSVSRLVSEMIEAAIEPPPAKSRQRKN